MTTLDVMAEITGSLAGAGEDWLLSWRGEDSLFVRFNEGRVRQAGRVRQDEVTLRWIVDGCTAVSSLTLSGVRAEDEARLTEAVARLRAVTDVIPPDPHLLVCREPAEGVSDSGEPGPGVDEVVRTVTDASRGLDLVGFWQSGDVHRGLASSFGHRLVHTSRSQALDFTVVATADRAVKRTVAGDRWDPARINAEIDAAGRLVPLVAREPMSVRPGSYRAWLTPVAMGEILSLLGAFGDLGARAVHTRTSALARMVTGATLHPAVSWAEDVAGGTGPGFQDDGFMRPGRVALVQGGRYAGCLTSPRSALEHGVEHNGADASEMPTSLVMEPGGLAEADAMAALGTGIWVSNLWYLNHSARSHGRFTGMTRFATMWVEDGVPVAPLSVMRFDDSLYEIFGDRLEAIGDTSELLPSLDTYGGRSTASMRLPGVLVSGLMFTL